MPSSPPSPYPAGLCRRPPRSFPTPGKRTGLTLLELLAVAVVLAIVWAFVYPATDAVRRASRRRQALTEAQSLATAVLHYRDTYGHWPLQTNSPAMDLIYGTNVTVDADSATLLDHAALIQALTPTLTKTNNVRQIAFLEIDSDRLHDGCFLDPWSTTNAPMPYVVAVDANGDGWIGRRDGNRIEGIEVQATNAIAPHTIPAVQEPAYAFSWSGNDTNRVSTFCQP